MSGFLGLPNIYSHLYHLPLLVDVWLSIEIFGFADVHLV